MNYAWREAWDKFGEIYRMSNLFPIHRASLLKKLVLAGGLIVYSAQPFFNDYFRVDICKSAIREFIYNLPGKSMQRLIPYCKELEKNVFQKFGNQTARFILYEKNTDRLQRPVATEAVRPIDAAIFSIMIGNLNGDYPLK